MTAAPLRWITVLLLLGVLTSAGSIDPAAGASAPPMVPLTEMGKRLYHGFPGGLYPGGRNDPPQAHRARGLAQAAAIRPLDREGRPSAGGRIVLLSIGMSNASQEFCSARNGPCTSWSFMGRAASDRAVRRGSLVILNGAAGGQTAGRWDTPDERNYDRIRERILAPRGLSERQVQVIWLKPANSHPRVSLPSEEADAAVLLESLGDIVRSLKARYPNLRQVFISSRTYGGYAQTTLNPEPFAYESGFAVKWLIEAQIAQMAAGRVVDSRAGDLDWTRAAPWLAWGPYLWARGRTPRADGLVWRRTDFEADGVHPSDSGESKVGSLLLAFFKRSPFTSCWFLAGRSCRQ